MWMYHIISEEIILTNVIGLSTISNSFEMMAFEELLNFTIMKDAFSNFYFPDTKIVMLSLLRN